MSGRCPALPETNPGCPFRSIRSSIGIIAANKRVCAVRVPPIAIGASETHRAPSVASIAPHRKRAEPANADAFVPVERGCHRAEDDCHDEIRFGDANLALRGKAADQTGTDHRECFDYLSVAANLMAAAAPCVCATFFTRARLVAGRPRRSPMYCPWILRTATASGLARLGSLIDHFRPLPGHDRPLDGSRHFRRFFRLSEAIAQTPAKQGQFSLLPRRPTRGRAVNQRRPIVRGALTWLPRCDSNFRPGG